MDATSKPALNLNIMKRVFYEMMSLEKYSNAGKIASVSVFGEDSAVAIDLYRHLAFSGEATSVIKAKALGWLASLHNGRGENEESRKLLRQARQAFHETQHAYALAELDLTEAHQEFTGQIIELEEPVTKFVAICGDLLYYRGVIEATDNLRKIADKANLGPISLELSSQVESLAERTNANLIRDQARLNCIEAWYTLSDHSGKAINAALHLYESLGESDCFPLRQRAAQLAASIYAKLKDNEQAVSWARKCIEDSKRCSNLIQSRAALAFIECEFLDLSGPEDARGKYAEAMMFVKAEVGSANHGLALSMLNALMITLTAAKAISGVDCSEYVPEVTQFIDSVKSQLSLEASQEVSPLLLHAQAVQLYQQSKTSLDISMEEEAIVLLRKARRMRLAANEYSESARLHGLSGKIYHGIVSKFRTSEGYTDTDLVRKYLKLALQQYSYATKHFEICQVVAEIAKYKQHEAQVLYECWGFGDVSFNTVLEKLHHAQVYSDQVRTELTLLGGLNAIENKRRIGAIKATRSGFAIALHVATHEGMALPAWEWTQRAKARSLCDLLGSETLVPKELLAQIAANKEALGLYETARQRVQSHEETQSLSSITGQMELDEHVANMRQNPLLKTLLELREGAPLSLSSMQQALKRLKRPLRDRDIILADWIFRGDEIWMLIVRDNGEPTLDMLPITASAVEEWTTRHLQSSPEQDSCILTDNREEQHPMHKLTPLVQLLVNSCQAEDVLILSPTEMLHSIPLHALLVLCKGRQMSLIERNPIVYAASMTSFFQCCQKARDSAPREDLTKSFVEAYEDFPGYEFNLGEQKSIQKLMAQMAEETDGEYHSGEDVLFDDFSRIAERSQMLFFLGHCDLETDDIRSQGLRLPMPADYEDGESSKTLHPLLIADHVFLPVNLNVKH